MTRGVDVMQAHDIPIFLEPAYPLKGLVCLPRAGQTKRTIS